MLARRVTPLTDAERAAGLELSRRRALGWQVFTGGVVLACGAVVVGLGWVIWSLARRA